MAKDYSSITRNIRSGVRTLRKEIPDVLSGFTQFAASATEDGALDEKTKELIALALSVASHCDGCIGFHTQTLARLGATQAEVAETLGTAVYMGGGPSLMYAAEAIQAFESALAQQQHAGAA